MKRRLLSILIIASVSASAKAQLSNTMWKGIVNVPAPDECILKFGSDTVSLVYAGDASIDLPDANGNFISVTGKDSVAFEKMTYIVSGNTISLKKVSGGSPCDNTVIGKYTYTIINNELKLAVIDDACDARSSAWNASYKKL